MVGQSVVYIHVCNVQETNASTCALSQTIVGILCEPRMLSHNDILLLHTQLNIHLDVHFPTLSSMQDITL